MAPENLALIEGNVRPGLCTAADLSLMGQALGEIFGLR